MMTVIMVVKMVTNDNNYDGSNDDDRNDDTSYDDNTVSTLSMLSSLS